MLHHRWPLIALPLVLLGLTLTSFWFKRFGPPLLINETPSEPRGVYRLKSHPLSDYRRGMYVVFPVPATAQDLVYGRRWLRERWPLLKELAGMSGDRVCITEVEVRLNETSLGPVWSKDTQGLPLPHLRGCFVIPAGYFFAASRRSGKSFDGRYFGALPLSQVSAEAVPVWTF